MNADDYLYPYQGKDAFLQYFANNPLKHWSFERFERHFSALSKKTLAGKYHRCMTRIGQDNMTPKYVKERIESNEPTTTNNTYYIGEGSSVITGGNDSIVSISNQPQQSLQSPPPPPPPQQQQQLQEPQQQQPQPEQDEDEERVTHFIETLRQQSPQQF
ncbi:unnamed protein product [Absidia cylindrospora]